MILTGAGLTLDVPRGWDAEITVRPGEGARSDGLALVHAASFPIPPDPGDFAGRAIAAMGLRDVLVVVFEYDPASASTRLFAHAGIPRLEPGDFDVRNIHESSRGQAAAQYFFHLAGRAFSVYAVIGMARLRGILVGVAQDVLDGLSIEASVSRPGTPPEA